MKKIFISGSCVSRDTLEFLDKSQYELVAYHARSSLATLGSPSCNDVKSYIDAIDSKFQQRMVSADLSRSLCKVITQKEFDVFLIDLIDERFHLAVLDGQLLATCSNEFLKSKAIIKSKINTFSEPYFAKWKNGVSGLFNTLTKDQISKIIVQKAYWTNILDTGVKVESIADEVISQHNAKLDRMYDYLSNFLDESQFVEFPKELLVINSNHKWGISAFHYVDDYYHYLNKQLGFK